MNEVIETNDESQENLNPKDTSTSILGGGDSAIDLPRPPLSPKRTGSKSRTLPASLHSYCFETSGFRLYGGSLNIWFGGRFYKLNRPFLARFQKSPGPEVSKH